MAGGFEVAQDYGAGSSELDFDGGIELAAAVGGGWVRVGWGE